MKIVLVHGSGHGAWCWYKVAAALRSQGFSVTAVDLAASGHDPRKLGEDVSNFGEYTSPLTEFMASVPEGEEVALVGHSFGGLSLASAMEAFPQKIAIAIFVTAFLPDTIHSPLHIFQELFKKSQDMLAGIEEKSVQVPGKSEPFKVLIYGSDFLQKWFYQKCSLEDFTLASIVVRPASLFQEDFSNKIYSDKRYGSVDKAFILCGEDALLTIEFQQWMIENYSVKQVMEIKDADHMPMLSTPEELCRCLTTFFSNYVK